MSIRHLRIIEGIISEKLSKHIDISDIPQNFKKEPRPFILSRGLSALGIMTETGIPAEDSVKHIVDGFKDNGIDAIYYDEDDDKLLLVQSKWMEKPNKFPDKGDVLKFKNGVMNLLQSKYELFNDRINKMKPLIDKAISSVDTKIVVMIIFSSDGKPNDEIKPIFDELLSELGGQEIGEIKILDQSKIYSSLSSITTGKPINETLQIYNGCVVNTPFKAFQGQISGESLYELFGKYRKRLFHRNIRNFLGPSDVNKDIRKTIINFPEEFWYRNNGITLLCDSARKPPKVVGQHEAMDVFCEGITIVNGAQTVGSIGEMDKHYRDKLSIARIPIRIMDLSDCPEGFAEKITFSTNNQNKIESRDFVSLDPVQRNIKTDLLALGYNYTYKRGREEGEYSNEVLFEDAAIGLACQHSIELATISKNKVTDLWQDTSDKPYKLIFNEQTDRENLIFCAMMNAVVEHEISILGQKEPKKKNFYRAANRFILYRAFTTISAKLDFEELKKEVRDKISGIARLTLDAHEKLFSGSYPMATFKSPTKSRQLEAEMDGKPVPRKSEIAGQMDLSDYFLE